MQKVEESHITQVYLLKEQGYLELDHLISMRRRQSRRARAVEDYLEAMTGYNKRVKVVITQVKSRALDMVFSTLDSMAETSCCFNS